MCPGDQRAGDEGSEAHDHHHPRDGQELRAGRRPATQRKPRLLRHPQEVMSLSDPHAVVEMCPKCLGMFMELLKT